MSLCITRTIVELDGEGYLQFNVAERPVPLESSLQDDQVLIALEACPVNPSDIGPLFAPSHGGIGKFDGARTSVDAKGRISTALPLPARTFKSLKGSSAFGRANRVGNEGAGYVIGAGKSPAAQALKGKLVACMGMGGSYAQHAVVSVPQCLVHNAGTTAAEAASSFVNPLTALGMVKTMTAENHTGIVHTAAASQLGQMLVKICKADGVPLVNIVRRQEQVDLLRSIGAEYVVSSTSKTYEQDLVDALMATGATIAFDATGGGTLGFEIIKGMETAAKKKGGAVNNYGSSVLKKLYIYGGLNAGEPLMLRPHAGMGGFSWSVAGFLLGSGTAAITDADRARVAAEIKTTFKSFYNTHLSLEQMLEVSNMQEYQAQKSNTKSLVTPAVLTAAAKL